MQKTLEPFRKLPLPDESLSDEQIKVVEERAAEQLNRGYKRLIGAIESAFPSTREVGQWIRVPNDGGTEARVARLEAQFEHVQEDLKEIKRDVRAAVFGIGAGLIALAALIVYKR